jgi:hypothetical protein
MTTHLPGVHQDLMGMVDSWVVLHGVVRRVVSGRLMKSGRPRMMQRGPVMMRFVSVRRLVLIARMRVLW